MNYTFVGKNIQVTDVLKERTRAKIDRIGKLFPEDTEVTVTFSVTKQTHKMEVTVPLHKRVLRAETVKDDMYVAIDSIVDVLEKQMVKYKNRLRDKSRRDSTYKDEYMANFKEPLSDEGDDAKMVVKSKKFALKPMDSEEAVLEMELLGHDFYVFRNGHTDEVNVVYKRKNGSYGLIEPEF